MNELFESIFSIEEKNLIIFIESITAITSVIYYYKYKNTYLRYLPIFLWYVLLNEITGRYMSVVANIDNHIIYNIYISINFIFILSIYLIFLKNKMYKQYVAYFIFTYILAFTLNGIFLDNYLLDLVTYPFVIGSCFLIVSVTFYFIEILNSEEVLNVTRNLLFWISVGVILFNIGIIPWVITLKLYLEDLSSIYMLFRALILILNICYITGFIWSHKVQKQEV